MSSEQKFNCIFCKDVFDSKEELQVHFRKHGDPKFNTKNKSRFSNDSEMPGDKPTDNAEMVGCDVCSEVFPTISKAITHKHKVHPDHDAKYFCPWCGKLFTMKHLYNKHMQSNHSGIERPDNKDFHCDSCDVDFYIPSAVAYHNKFFHRQDSDMPDVGQSKKFKLHNQEVIPLFYCAFCGEEYDNKVNLFKHMSDDHSDENQSPDEVLRCPLCEAIFYHLDAYEIHLTFHTSEDLYSIKNETYSDLQEFSLESLPPVVEKVENLEPQEDAETTLNSVGIDKFLELAMDRSQDTTVKAKKHKKHKKSKKAAITLDEFLSMNSDVFGEGLDFQGVEEVPTQVVTKRLKSNKRPVNTGTAAVTPLELQKLKQQGIVIKKKVSQNPPIRGIKVLKGVSPAGPLNTIKKPVLNKIKLDSGLNTSDEVLSKLISQSNNAIKIVKKPTPENIVQTEEISKSMDDIDDPMENIETQEEKISGSESNDEGKIELTKDESHIPGSTENNECINDTKFEESSVLKAVSAAAKRYNRENGTLPDINESIDSNTEKASADELLDNASLSKSIKTQKIEKIVKSLNSLQNKGQVVIKSKSINNEINNTEINENESEPENNAEGEESDGDDDPNIDDTQGSIVKNNTSNSQNKPLSALKHLSHLITVKPINQMKLNEGEVLPEDTSVTETHIQQSKTQIALGTVDKDITIKPKSNDKDPTLDALKNLSKNITIKSFPKPVTSVQERECETDIDMRHEIHEETSSNSLITKTNSSKSTKLINMSHNVENTNIGRPLKIMRAPDAPSPDNNVINKNANILKRLTNIITKPVPPKKVEQIVCMPTIIPRTMAPQNEDEIEIFNIDDSDDENINDANSKKIEPVTATKPIPALNISKKLTVKSVSQQCVQKSIKTENNTNSDEELNEEDRHSFPDDSDDGMIASVEKSEVVKTKSCSQKFSNRSMSVNNALKNLGKNITIKSRNSSPNLSVKSQDQCSQDSNADENEASDSDSNSGKVKITELDEHVSDGEDPETNMEQTTAAIVHSPEGSCGDENEYLDFEAEIKASTLQKTLNQSDKSPGLMNTLKHLGKNITIKSLSENNTEEKHKGSQENSDGSCNIKKQVAMKTFKQPTSAQQTDYIVGNRSSNTSTRPENSSTQSVNQKLSSSNQVNTVNKEVTVKTFQTQTKTVIQEITTTVTKTIKTVNQTMKQEIRNSSQVSTPIKMQRIQGMRQNQSQNLQGVVVRHAPPLGTRIGNPQGQVRPAGTMIRHSKQVVPVRPGLNIMRPSTPRIPTFRKPAPNPSPHKQVIGRPLKISPNAITTPPTMVKRPNSDEMTGPFSCFKKPKESLIPVSEVPNFSGEITAQHASTSHTNFTSTTKVVKGNSVVTSTQMKSEMSTSAQQISRLSNNTGLKIVKTSQSKQMQTQEKSETSPMQRTTLAAIERLQKQGLLVKKPRLDVNEDSDNSEPDDEQADYSSDGDHNE